MNLYKITMRETGHDICVNEFWEEGDEWLPESWDEVTIKYGYSIHPYFFKYEEGGTFSRKDSEYTEILSVERIDTLPEGEDTMYYYKNTYSSFVTQLANVSDWWLIIFNPYIFWKYRFIRNVKYSLYQLQREITYFKYSLRDYLYERGWG